MAMEPQALETQSNTKRMNETTHKYQPGMPPVAVIILNWNGSHLLREYLPAVVATTPGDLGRVIVADNGSEDDSLEILEREFPSVEVIRFDRNHGFARGYNKAIEETQYPYTVLLNSDVATDEGWLEPLYTFMETHEEAGGCQPKILSYRHRTTFEYAGACGGFIDRNGYPYCRGRIFDVCEEDHGQYDQEREVFWATGAALMVRTELYLQAGGLDPEFFAHMEEIDLCWRILLMGKSLWAVPSARVYHLGGGSLPPNNPRKVYLNFRNNLLMLHKNLPDSDRGATLLRRRLLDTIAWAKFVLSGQWRNAGAVVKAHRDFAHMRRQYTSHPSVNLLKARRDTRVNILIDFYLRGLRTFDRLRIGSGDE